MFDNKIAQNLSNLMEENYKNLSICSAHLGRQTMVFFGTPSISSLIKVSQGFSFSPLNSTQNTLKIVKIKLTLDKVLISRSSRGTGV